MRALRRAGIATLLAIGLASSFAVPASANVSFVRAFAVAGPSFGLDGSGNLYSASAGTVSHYKINGTFKDSFPVASNFSSPNDLEFARNRLYAVDAGSNKLLSWRPDGSTPLTSPDASDGNLNTARAVAVFGDVALVGSAENNRVEEVDVNTVFGQFLLAFGWGVDDGPGDDGQFSVCTPPHFCTSTGFLGPEPGKINDARDIAIDHSNGAIYVAEYNQTYSRVEQFNKTPAPARVIGAAGTGAGKLKGPSGVVLDGKGHLYVADSYNHRVAEFTDKGKFIRAFGFGVKNGASKFQVCTKDSGCQAGIAGTAHGQLDFPYRVAYDEGKLYVSNITGGQIEVYKVG